jgi:hypothetical protein
VRSRSDVCGFGAALVVVVGLGCAQPQSGLFAAGWCAPKPEAAAPFVALDDMEDGDDVPCNHAAGRWTIQGSGTISSPVGGVVEPTELDATDLAVRTDSLRALHVAGTLEAGGFVQLALPLAYYDLSGFQEIDFWARSDSAAQLQLDIAVTTDVAQQGYQTGATITSTWGEAPRPNSVALDALFNGTTPVAAGDLAAATSITFTYVSSVSGAFGFWLDDIKLKRR